MGNRNELLGVFMEIYAEEFAAMEKAMAICKADPTAENWAALKVMMDNVQNTQKVLIKNLGIES